MILRIRGTEYGTRRDVIINTLHVLYIEAHRTNPNLVIIHFIDGTETLTITAKMDDIKDAFEFQSPVREVRM